MDKDSSISVGTSSLNTSFAYFPKYLCPRTSYISIVGNLVRRALSLEMLNILYNGVNAPLELLTSVFSTVNISDR